VFLTSAREAVCKGRIEVPAPETPYGLSLGFSSLLSPSFMPWHRNHYECVEAGRRNPFFVDSFVLMLFEGNKRIMVPMEQAALKGCTMCAFFGKVGRYMCKAGSRYFPESIELVVDIDGKKHTTVVTPHHGIEANALLVHLLKSIRAGSVMHMTLGADSKGR
jgi:hypothetical protein